MDILGALKNMLDQAKAVARPNQGPAAKCALASCGTLTAGARCEKCSRAICIRHTFLHVEMPPSLKSYCPYCVVQMNAVLFRNGDDEDDGTEADTDNEPLDAEYTSE